MKKIIIAFLVASTLVCARGAAAGDDAALRATLQHDLDAYLSARASIEHISALSLSVNLLGRTANINVVSGRTAMGGAVPVEPSNLFNIGSNTKAFTACLLLQLEAEGKLSIDQTVGDWLPQYPAWSHVTIRQLLDMTSGIPTYDNSVEMGHAMAATIHRRWTDPMLIAFVDPVYGRAPAPTHGWSYSNTNYLLAGLIVERVTGHSYADELKHRLFGPLGLTDTYYSPNVYPKAITDRMVAGYFFNTDPGNEPLKPLRGRDVRLMDLSWAGPAGGIIATPQDVTYWTRALYSGKVLAPRQQRELASVVSMKTGKPLLAVTPADPMGFGLGVSESVRPKIGTYWFYQGETLGYRMIYVWLPKSDAVFAIGLNSQPTGSQGEHVGKLLVQIYEDLVASGAIRPNT